MKNKVRFIKLTDYDNRGKILKQEGHKFYSYVNGKWIRTGLSIGYFYPDAPEFDCYEEISEEEAMKLLKNN
nr:MAG TPA: hypothetical protein [Caudoviricetes sp.]